MGTVSGPDISLWYNNNIEKFGRYTRKTFSRFSAKDSYTRK
jgi:hypothetical protein